MQKEAYDTEYSQAVTHPSTNAAQSCLTSVIGREVVFSTWYGRKQEKCLMVLICFCQTVKQQAALVLVTGGGGTATQVGQ